MSTVLEALRTNGNTSARTVTIRPVAALPSTADEGELVYLSAPAGLYQRRAGLWILLGVADALHNYMVGSYRINITNTADLQLNPVAMPFDFDMTYGFLRGFLDDNGAGTATLDFDLGYVSPFMISSGNGRGGLDMTLAQIQAVNCVNVDALYTIYRNTGGTSLIAAREQMLLYIMDPATGLQVPATTTFALCTVYETQAKDQFVSHRNVGVISWQSPNHQAFLLQLTGTRRIGIRIMIDAPDLIGLRVLNGLLYFGSVRYSVN